MTNIEKVKLLHGDCLEVMDMLIEQGVKVDAIITDPPYGTTACKWDSIIPLDMMWERLNKLIKDNGAVCLFSSQPFTSALVMSNPKMFKYEWIWEKNIGSNFAVLKYQPMKEHEIVLVFSKKTHNYYPIMQDRKGGGLARTKYAYKRTENSRSEVMGGFLPTHGKHNGSNEKRYPSSIQKFNREVGLHPTQKPVTLLEYLVLTYTNEGDKVLDFTMGSGSTGVACVNTNRNFIGIEQDDKYFEIAKERIERSEEERNEIDGDADESLKVFVDCGSKQ